MSKCIGCGVKIQTTNKDLPGYVPEIVLLENGEDVYCKRCHDIIHHNAKYEVDNDLNRYYEKICRIKDTNSLIILIIDILDIYNGFIPQLEKYIGQNKVLIVVNKVDLLPKSVKLNSIELKVKAIATKQHLNIVHVMMISAKKENDVKRVVNKISALKYHPKYKHKSFFDDCYVMGCASVGKSTFINTMCKIYLNQEKGFITTSDQFHTTVDMIKIPLDDHDFIIDTPGIINYNSFGAYLDYESMQIITPNSYIKPRTYQLTNGQTMFLGNLCQIDFVSGEKVSASFYVSNDLYLHRTKTENAESFKINQSLKLLVPPFKQSILDTISDLKTYDFKLEENQLACDLLISGLGIIHLSGSGLIIKLHIDKKINVVWKEFLV